MLLACAAWLLHVTPLLTPLWSDQADLGHGICIELAPVVSAAQQHEQKATAAMQLAGHTHHQNGVYSPKGHLSADYQHNVNVNVNSVNDATHHHNHHAQHVSQHHDKHQAMALPSGSYAPLEAISTQSHAVVDADNTAAGKGHHTSCDICAAMSAVMIPVGIVPTAARVVESAPILVAILPPQVASDLAAYLRPFSRAPPLW